MRYFATGSMALALMLLLSGTASAEGQGASGWQQFQQGLKKSAREIGKTGTEAGRGAVKGARKGGDSLNQIFSGNGGNKGGKSK